MAEFTVGEDLELVGHAQIVAVRGDAIGDHASRTCDR
jgi:hypothetical protein